MSGEALNSLRSAAGPVIEMLNCLFRNASVANADKIVAEKQRDVLRDLIDQQLLLQKGKDLGITGDTELIKRLDEMRKLLVAALPGLAGSDDEEHSLLARARR